MSEKKEPARVLVMRTGTDSYEVYVDGKKVDPVYSVKFELTSDNRKPQLVIRYGGPRGGSFALSRAYGDFKYVDAVRGKEDDTVCSDDTVCDALCSLFCSEQQRQRLLNSIRRYLSARGGL